MDNAKKLLLVDPSRSTQLYRPTIADKKLSQLDHDLTDALNSDMSNDEKSKRYMMILRDHRKYSIPAVSVKPDPDVEILKLVEPKKRIKAKRLLKSIRPYVRLSDEGEIVHETNLVQNSNIAELLNDALEKDSVERPKGWTAFADALKRAGTSSELISNSKLWTYMNPRSKKTIKKRNWLAL